MTATESYQPHQLYTDHHGWLHGWLRKKLGCTHMAADLAHDTFLLVLRKRELTPLREPRAYLTTLAHGLLVNHWRRLDIERAYLETLAAQPQKAAPSPEEQALLLETLYALDALLSKLPAKVRSAFLMAQLEDLTYAVIATQLGVSERMVKKYMAQAMLHCLTLEL